MRHFKFVVLVCAVSTFTALAQNEGSIPGFLPSHVKSQRTQEHQALADVQERSAEQFLYDLTREPHQAGSPGDRRNAEYVQKRFREFGLDSKIVEYYVLIPYPVEVKLTIVDPIEKELAIKENVEFAPNALIPFNAYSPSADLTTQVAYVNYGTPADFEKLKELGIDVKGKIVIARYGKIYRGDKVKEATKAGAAGVILYSDPNDDGYMAGDVYPKGPMRPWDGVQRGDIHSSDHYSGDPLTPGYAATKDAKRIPMKDDPDMPQIPCTPISYGDAQYILKTIEGPVVPREWQGGLPFTYHVGVGPTTVHMQLKMDFQIRPIWDNIAVLKGSEEPGREVIIGGHRDAWVFGAQDPNSGSAVVLEAARVIGERVRKGWKPKRSIVFTQWDGEEYGLIGSTEWGEQNEGDLRKNGVVYMNFDATISGSRFGASSTPLLDAFVRSITKDVNDPNRNIPVFNTWWLSQNGEKGKTLEQTIPEMATTKLGRMGGGSDHVVFLTHIGVPSMGFGFGGRGGIYHSYYDNFDWMKRFGDPGFKYHAAAARLAALAAMRMADADILPFALTPYAQEVINQIDNVQKKLNGITGGDALDLAALRAKAELWKTEAEQTDQAIASASSSGSLVKVNDLLMSIERSFVAKQGLPGREWYKHRIVAASGYASVGLPGIVDAVDTSDWKTAANEVKLFDGILDQVIESTKSIRPLL